MTSRVDLEVQGEGPAVLFLHGTPTPWDILRPLADGCIGRTTLLAALPGYGVAHPWSETVTAVVIAEAIEEAVRAAGFHRVQVVGFSGGAHHALRLATRGVIAVETVVALGAIADLSIEERAAMRGIALSLRISPIPPGFATARFLSPGFAARSPAATRRVEGWMDACSPATLAAELLAVADAPQLLPALASFGGRVVARTGSLDLAASPLHAHAIAGACPDGRVQIVEGRGHALLEEDREDTVAAVMAALDVV